MLHVHVSCFGLYKGSLKHWVWSRYIATHLTCVVSSHPHTLYMSGLSECVCLSTTAKSDGGATGRCDPRAAEPRGSGPGPSSRHDATPSTFQRPAHTPRRHGIRARHRHPLDGLAHGMPLPVTLRYRDSCFWFCLLLLVCVIASEHLQMFLCDS